MKSIKLLFLFFLSYSTLYGQVDSFSTRFGLEGTSANLFNGAIAEHISSAMYKKNGYSQLDGEVGRNGVDGLFVRRDSSGKIKEVVFSEVKHGNAQLGTIKKGTINQMSKDWQIVKIDEKIKSLKKILVTENIKKQIEELKTIKSMVTNKSKNVKIQITRLKNLGNNKYTININELAENNSSKMRKSKQLKHKANNLIIDLNKNYKVGSDEWKFKKIISHSIRKERRLVKESKKLKKYKKELKQLTKLSKQYIQKLKYIKEQEKLIKRIEKSRPSIYKSKKQTYNTLNKGSNLIQDAIPITFFKKGKKILSFVDAKVFKNISKVKYLKNVKGSDVVMVAIEAGIVTYSLLKGGITYKKVSNLLVSGGKTTSSHLFSKGFLLLTPPPATIAIIATIAGTIIIDYTIDKYIELDKRNYIGLEDMLWDIPEEIKNKITVLNIEDVKKNTVFDFSEIDEETILDESNEKETVFENDDREKETIFN